jgi:hypothetical protein
MNKINKKVNETLRIQNKDYILLHSLSGVIEKLEENCYQQSNVPQ